VHDVNLDPTAEQFVAEASAGHTVRIIANRPDTGAKEEYDSKLREALDSHHLNPADPLLFVEVRLGDASEFSGRLDVYGFEVGGHRVLRCQGPAVPNAIAALLLNIRDRTRLIPHAYFGWTEGNRSHMCSSTWRLAKAIPRRLPERCCGRPNAIRN
jgi:hypothetical protein